MKSKSSARCRSKRRRYHVYDHFLALFTRSFYLFAATSRNLGMHDLIQNVELGAIVKNNLPQLRAIERSIFVEDRRPPFLHDIGKGGASWSYNLA
jgi:hypothetical protein